jgi:hypothetical protein
MDLEKEYENRNMECTKPVSARSTKVLHNELSNLVFNVVTLQETWLESGIQKFNKFAIFNNVDQKTKKNMSLVVDFM